MPRDEVVLRFDAVSFGYEGAPPLLEEASFSVRTHGRITLMGQNGAGKSTLCKLISGEEKPVSGRIFRTPADATIALARQAMPKTALGMTVREYFASALAD